MRKRYSLTEPIKVLLVEDSPDDAALFERHLSRASQRPIDLVLASDLADGVLNLGEDVDLVFLALALSDSDDLATFQRVREYAPFVPIIILTNNANNELAMDALRSGADDILAKDELTHSLIERSMMYAFERRYAAEVHEKLAEIVASTRDSVVGATLEGIVESWNRGASEIYGYSADEMIGKPLSIIVPPELLFEQYDYLEKIKAGETVPTFETRRRARNGEERIISLNATAIRDTAGRVTGCSLIGRDITLQLFGLDAKTFDGSFRSFLHCVSERDRERVYIKSQGNLESDEEFEVIWPDGSAHDVLAKGREYIDGNGVRTWAGICMDVTERRQAQRETALLKLLQQREEFMATLAHDLKNPLIAVRRLLEMLIAGRMGTMTEEQTNLMVQIMETNSGLLSLIKNLLDIYREEQHALGHAREQTDVRKLVDECVSQFEPIAQMRSVQIHKQVPNEPVPMIADSNGIRTDFAKSSRQCRQV
ncbi:unnamed protein product [Sphagnum compactum]